MKKLLLIGVTSALVFPAFKSAHATAPRCREVFTENITNLKSQDFQEEMARFIRTVKNQSDSLTRKELNALSLTHLLTALDIKRIDLYFQNLNTALSMLPEKKSQRLLSASLDNLSHVLNLQATNEVSMAAIQSSLKPLHDRYSKYTNPYRAILVDNFLKQLNSSHTQKISDSSLEWFAKIDANSQSLVLSSIKKTNKDNFQKIYFELLFYTKISRPDVFLKFIDSGGEFANLVQEILRWKAKVNLRGPVEKEFIQQIVPFLQEQSKNFVLSDYDRSKIKKSLQEFTKAQSEYIPPKAGDILSNARRSFWGYLHGEKLIVDSLNQFHQDFLNGKGGKSSLILVDETALTLKKIIAETVNSGDHFANLVQVILNWKANVYLHEPADREFIQQIVPRLQKQSKNFVLSDYDRSKIKESLQEFTKSQRKYIPTVGAILSNARLSFWGDLPGEKLIIDALNQFHQDFLNVEGPKKSRILVEEIASTLNKIIADTVKSGDHFANLVQVILSWKANVHLSGPADIVFIRRIVPHLQEQSKDFELSDYERSKIKESLQEFTNAQNEYVYKINEILSKASGNFWGSMQ